MEPSGANNGDDVNINAWGIPVLRYTEEDRVKQKFVETIHRVEWREREQLRARQLHLGDLNLKPQK